MKGTIPHFFLGLSKLVIAIFTIPHIDNYTASLSIKFYHTNSINSTEMLINRQSKSLSSYEI